MKWRPGIAARPESIMGGIVATEAGKMRLRPKLYLAAILAFALPAHADGPLVHEYIPPDATEDLRMGATTQDGQMPAAIDTRSGVLAAPADQRTSPSQVAYGG